MTIEPRHEVEANAIINAHTYGIVRECDDGPVEEVTGPLLAMDIAAALADAEARGKAKGAREEREACLADIGGERVDAEGSESSEDIAYNAALGHAAGAIKSRAAIQAEKECT